MPEPGLLTPDWPAPPRVRALQTLRGGGCSPAPWDSFNLGDHVGDDPARVAANRAVLRRRLPAGPVWLRQVHGTVAVDAAICPENAEADAAFARRPGVVCAVMTADCLPVLFCDRAGTVVAAAHAGWRGLAAGVIERTLSAMNCDDVSVWLGPAIGPDHFEVGDEVREAFLDTDANAAVAFRSHGPGKWLADIYQLASLQLAELGVDSIHGGGLCTVADSGRFYSYRRDGAATGRMASLIWRQH